MRKEKALAADKAYHSQIDLHFDEAQRSVFVVTSEDKGFQLSSSYPLPQR